MNEHWLVARLYCSKPLSEVAVVYLWLKAFHVIAAIVWIGGMLATSILILSSVREGQQIQKASSSTLITSVRRWDQRVTSPAMFVTWALGLAIALLGGWFPAAWLIVKLCIVLLLSALYGWLSRKLFWQQEKKSISAFPKPQCIPFVVILAIAAIVMLVVTKPI
ncbi:CopD family protein [Acetobacter farinalis]|uniref:CopD family protein n=1 Tax=Acetobacter farinalis TaxID=1260984 RepID=UPI0019E43684|nr:CopD family protein [Acetobacter farinalis]NHO30400.1 hypothetical protein [Acetobacter farinalis]